MSPHQKRSVVSRFLGLIFHDPWRKLAAIGLAFGLWIYLDGRVSKTETVTLSLSARDINQPRNDKGATKQEANHGTLELVLPAKDYTVSGDDFRTPANQLVAAVKLTIKGGNRAVDNLLQDLSFQVEPRSKDLAEAEKVGWFEFDKESIRPTRDPADHEELLKGMTMEPPRIRVMLRRNASRETVLSWEMVKLVFAEPNLRLRILEKDATFEPHDIMLRGPRDILQDNVEVDRELFSGEIPLAADTSRSQVRIPIKLLPKLQQLQIEGGPVYVTYPIQPDFKRFELLNVPVTLDTTILASEKVLDRTFQLEEKVIHSLKLEVTGELERQLTLIQNSPKKLEQWTADHVRLEVQLERRDLTMPVTDAQSRKPRLRIVTKTRNYVRDKDYRAGNVESVTITVKEKK